MSARSQKHNEPLAQALRLALEHHAAGRLAEAERLVLQILQFDPQHAEALHLLGLMAHQAGQDERAAGLLERAVRRKPRDPNYLNNFGNVLNRLGRAEEAERMFRRALSLKPVMAEAHYNLGIALQAQGNLAGAETAYRRALALRPDLAEAHFTLGGACLQQGQLEKAEAAYRRAIELMPDFAEGHNNLGIVCQEQGRLEEAASHYRRALQVNSSLAEAHNNLGLVLQEQGAIGEALACHERALRIEPGNALFWLFYSECLKVCPTANIDAVAEDLVVTALKHEAIDPGNIAPVAAALALRDPLLLALSDPARELAERAQQAEALLLEGRLNATLERPLLLALLEEAVVPDYRLEEAWTLIRRAALNAVMRSPQALAGESLERFLSALALQCFATEYVYAETPDEARAVQSLAAEVQSGAAVSMLRLVLAAAYRPLRSLGITPTSLSLEAMADHVRAVIQRQVVEPAREDALKETIPCLTGVEDDVSRQVRAQYEESPYPRWRRIGNAGEAKPIHGVLRKLFPALSIEGDSPDRPDVLVAGCGTGSHSIQVARHFRNARVLAVDLSLASLAYAKWVTEVLQLANIDYQQADILKLGGLERHFDLIQASGVLHHLHDPLQGWKVLVGLLKPHGYMKIGLYSRRARADITAARALIEQRGYAATLDGIRQCRQGLATGGPQRSWERILSSADFYSTSGCRDMLFHVQEHLFSPAEIQGHLDTLGLEFLGFELDDPQAKQRYRERFPEDAACVSIANWEAFEQDHPYTFIRMYEIWARRK